MRQEIINVYSFNELSKESQQNAIDALYDLNILDQWYEWIIEEFTEKLNNSGFEVETNNIQFSGFSSQGDGASFTSAIDILKYIDSFNYKDEFNFLYWAIKNEYIDFSIEIYRNTSRYSHENTVSINSNLNSTFFNDKTENRCINIINNSIDKLESYLIEDKNQLCRELYNSLQSEYEWLTSKECIIETIEINDYEFYGNGELH